MILDEEERDLLGEAQRELDAAIQDQGSSPRLIRALTALRDSQVVAAHQTHRHTRGIVVELARTLSIGRDTPVHRSTVHRILLHAVTGRHAYRAAPTRKRKTAKESTS